MDAVAKLPAEIPTPKRAPGGPSAVLPARFDPQFYKPKEAVVEQLAAVSVGIIDGEVRLDLDYFDDSRANVDMNVAYTANGNFVEIQGSAENGQGFARGQMNALLDVAVRGCEGLFEIQRRALNTNSRLI
jgi:ribonuclease PH